MKKISTLLIIAMGLISVSQPSFAAFSDVPSDHPYFEAVNYLQETGTVEGTGNNHFGVDEPVNRAAVTKIILLGSGIFVPEIQSQSIAPDVPYDTWYAKYFAKAKNMGILNGDAKTGLMRPGDEVNLAEILKILLETNNVTLSSPTVAPYPDVPPEAWFAPYFDYAASISLLPQSRSENVNPSMIVSRGLMAELMYQLTLKPQGYTEGEASYYSDQFQGDGTASGEAYDASAFTAAHRTFPFGTWLEVKNIENGKTVRVKVNDRGPYSENRIIDLSKAAFEAISPLSRGVIKVSISPVSEPSDASAPTQEIANCSITNRTHHSKNTFENITLDRDFSNIFLASEVFKITGSSASQNNEVSAFLVDKNGKQFPFYSTVNKEGKFELSIHFPSTGKYQFGVIPGTMGSGIVEEILVLEDSCLKEEMNESLLRLSDLKVSDQSGNLIISWNEDHAFEVVKINFIQESRQAEYLVYDSNSISPYYPDFEGWKEGPVQVVIQGANLDNQDLLEQPLVQWGPPISLNFNATLHHEYIVEKTGVDIINLPGHLESGKGLKLTFDPQKNVEEKGLVIMPNGLVQEVSLTSQTHSPLTNAKGVRIFPSTATALELSFTPKTNEVHFAEINDEESQAVINIPLYPAGTFPLLPNPIDLAGIEKTNLGSDLGSLQNKMLTLTNQDRAIHQRSALKLDPLMNTLAQKKAEDMVERQYFSHWTPEGLTTNELRKDVGIIQYVSENLARDSSLELAHYGLMRSASHRANILEAEWKRAGFGIAKDGDNGYVFVQVFSDDPIDFANSTEIRTKILTALNSKRSNPISLQDNLNTIAQTWSERMVAETFFDFTAPDSITLVDSLHNAGINQTLGTYLVGNSSLESAIDQISANTQILESRWKKLGIGIKQDPFGIIKITLAYTE